MVNYKHGKITAIVAVRKGSVRCPNKNIKPFGEDTNLLTLKLKILKKVKNLDKIIVTTDCDISKLIGNIMGVTVLTRPDYYCSDMCSGSEMQEYIAKQCSTEHILYSPVTSPFITSEFFEELIEQYKNLDNNDSIALKSDIKEFLWNNKNPINYDVKNFPRSQDLDKNIFSINFGCCIIPTKLMIEKKYMVGNSPLFVSNKTKYANIDIDEITDFEMANIIYKKEFKTNKKLKFIDVTIRDGGFTNNWNWAYQDVVNLYNLVADLNYEYFEIGYFINENLKEENSGIWRNLPVDILDNFPLREKCKISVMIDYWKYDIEKLKPRSITKIDLIRVTCYKENILEGIEYCKKVKELGYEISFNLIVISYYNTSDLNNLVKLILEKGRFFDYICIADSYGNMNTKKTKEILGYLLSYFNCLEIPIGYHIHENIGNGMNNGLEAINLGIDVLDTTLFGIGRGFGNLSMNNILTYLNSVGKVDNSDIFKLFKFCDKFYPDKIQKNIQNLQGIYNIHPKSFDIIKDDKSLYNTFKNILNLSEEQKYHYLNFK